MRGETTDGNQYIVDSRLDPQRRSRHSHRLAARLHRAPRQSRHGERGHRWWSTAAALSPQSQCRRLRPSRAASSKLSAVTGTNGKTTTAFLLEASCAPICRRAGPVLHRHHRIRTSPATVYVPANTPRREPAISSQLFRRGVNRAGCNRGRHGDVQLPRSRPGARLGLCPSTSLIFTNLTQDHLDYHGTMERYAQAKAAALRRRRRRRRRAVAFINADDAYAAQMIRSVPTAGRSSVAHLRHRTPADLARQKRSRCRLGATTFTLRTPARNATSQSTPLTGRVNIYNLLAAMCAAHGMRPRARSPSSRRPCPATAPGPRTFRGRPQDRKRCAASPSSSTTPTPTTPSST